MNLSNTKLILVSSSSDSGDEAKSRKIWPCEVDISALADAEFTVSCKECSWSGSFSLLFRHLADTHLDFADRKGLNCFQCLGCDNKFLSHTLLAAHVCIDGKNIKEAFLLRPFQGTGTVNPYDMLQFLHVIGGTIRNQLESIPVCCIKFKRSFHLSCSHGIGLSRRSEMDQFVSCCRITDPGRCLEAHFSEETVKY